MNKKILSDIFEQTMGIRENTHTHRASRTVRWLRLAIQRLVFVFVYIFSLFYGPTKVHNDGPKVEQHVTTKKTFGMSINKCVCAASVRSQGPSSK